MSAGPFISVIYSTDAGVNFNARVQPETAAPAWQGTGSGVITGVGRVRMTGGRRKFGVNARYVSGRWLTGSAPAGYLDRATVRVPVLTKTAFEAIALGTTLAYLGGSFEVTGLTNEKIN